MPPPALPTPSPWSRRRSLALIAVLLGALVSAWLFQAVREGDADPPSNVSGPPLPAPAAPTPDPAASAAGARTLEETGETDEPTVASPRAYDPVPTSDNTDLSLARRAGLHRAPNPLRLTSSVALALDSSTGEVIYQRNELAILPIASLTKLMTAMVLLDAGLPLSEPIRITREDVDTLRHSRSRLRVGTTLSRRQALRLALMSSENRAAHALARTYPGGVPAFVARMNRKAAELGMAHSRFADPTGLLNQNRATAKDVATLVLAASKYPLVRSFSTTPRHQATFGKRRLQYLNSNRLVRRSGWPILVQKTGYIVEAGQCVAMLTRARGRDIVLVVMDAGSFTTRTNDARKLRRHAIASVREQGAVGESGKARAPR